MATNILLSTLWLKAQWSQGFWLNGKWILPRDEYLKEVENEVGAAPATFQDTALLKDKPVLTRHGISTDYWGGRAYSCRYEVQYIHCFTC